MLDEYRRESHHVVIPPRDLGKTRVQKRGQNVPDDRLSIHGQLVEDGQDVAAFGPGDPGEIVGQLTRTERAEQVLGEQPVTQQGDVGNGLVQPGVHPSGQADVQVVCVRGDTMPPQGALQHAQRDGAAASRGPRHAHQGNPGHGRDDPLFAAVEAVAVKTLLQAAEIAHSGLHAIQGAELLPEATQGVQPFSRPHVPQSGHVAQRVVEPA